MRGERGGTIGVLDRRAGEREGGRETLTHVWAKKHTGKRPVNAETQVEPETEQKNTSICILMDICRLIKRLQPIRPARQMPTPDNPRTQGTRWRYFRKHTGVPQSSTSLPKTCRKESYGERQRRCVRFMVRQHFVPLTCDPALTPSPSLL